MGMAGMNGLNSMNGMNMGMNFNPSQGMYGAGWNGQNGNMWNGPQSNNPNAFSNGMGGDFGSNSGYGYNPSQQGNFHQHQYPNGDFQSGYQVRGFGRGRFRARGGYGRGRGGYGQVSQGNYTNSQHPYELQQQEIQNMQAQMTANQVSQSEPNEQLESNVPSARDEQQQLNFAPGGQDEVQEALGDDYSKAETTIEPEATAVEDAASEVAITAEDVPQLKESGPSKDKPPIPDPSDTVKPIPALSPTRDESEAPATKEIPSAAAESDVTEAPMPPPSAPLGPAAQFAGPARDYGFRGRGHGRLPSRGRGSFPVVNGHPISPVKPTSASLFKAPVEPKGTGVVGAPTGPKAMRTAAVNGPMHPIRGRGGGFQIVGRASMTSRGSISVASEKSRSVTPPNNARDEIDRGSRSSSHQRSRHHHHSSRRETDTEEERERKHDRKSRRSRHDDNDHDHDMQDGSQGRSTSATPEESRRSSHRREKDRDRHSSSTKHQSSRSRRHRDGERDEMDDHSSERKSSRDVVDYDSKSSRRDRDRERDRHGSRSAQHDDKDRDDSHRERRKRSRRERADGGDVDEGEEESRHRSRRHKREHGHDRHEESVNGRRDSERSSAAATPVEPEKDMHTLEREARNRERMLKEQQRRENAVNAERAGGSKRHSVAGGRRMSYKYEDETQSAMVEQEREAARWR
jgi:hypothetical protein